MDVREANFGNDVLEAADLLHRRAGEKTTAHLCRSRVDQCVKRARGRGPGLRAALVACEDDAVRGFLYAEERQLFGLFPNTRVVEVLYLVGSHGAGLKLLQRLRRMTKLRIHVEAVAQLARPAALARLLRPMHPQPVTTVFQV